VTIPNHRTIKVSTLRTALSRTGIGRDEEPAVVRQRWLELRLMKQTILRRL
jgi:hypothetical protein